VWPLRAAGGVRGAMSVHSYEGSEMADWTPLLTPPRATAAAVIGGVKRRSSSPRDAAN